MKTISSFSLSIVTLIAIAAIWSTVTGTWTTVPGETYVKLLMFLPGVIFATLVTLTKSKNNSIQKKVLFIVLSGALYVAVFFASFIFQHPGLFVGPAIGALVFVAVANSFLSLGIKTEFYWYSLVAGPLSAGLGLLITRGDDNGQLVYLPIIIWWIYMAFLLDIAARKTRRNV
jgi:hypothetical protein